MSGNGGGGGQSLSGGPAEPLPEGWGAPSASRVGRVGQTAGGGGGGSRGGSGPRFATLGSSRNEPPSGPPGGHGHAHGDDDDDDDEEDQAPQSFFAGGERSGLSVEGPGRQRPGNSTVRDILRKAAEATQDRVGGLAGAFGGGQPAGPTFAGGGHTLGSDEVESRFIADPNAPPPDAEETAIRNITFWRQGFSVEDGPLMRYDDPANSRLLDDINGGHAPPAILNVRVGQPVELRVQRRLDEDYTPPAGARNFTGSGNRLGAAVPHEGAHAAPPPPAEGTRIPISPSFELDLSVPTASIQLRLSDGSRMTVRLNQTHTIGDLRNYINAHQRGFAGRAYTLSTTFPTRTLDDTNQTIKDAGIANSVVVHRWVE